MNGFAAERREALMTMSVIGLSIDCADAAALAGFWSEALGRPVTPGADAEHAAIDATDPASGPRLSFQKVPEPKTAKNRLHLDLNVGGELGTASEVRQQRVKEAQERLEALGATAVEWREEFGQQWLVMQDPEGNEFCLQ